YLAVWESFQQGDIRAAQEHQRTLTRLHAPFFNVGFPWLGTVKFIVSEVSGIEVGSPRRPNLSLSEEQKKEVRERLHKLQPLVEKTR
ncbi:MAG: hypothetical protein D6736_16765, partial [Nitrospinota bacterium]